MKSCSYKVQFMQKKSKDIISCASTLKVLADETRLEIVEQLLQGPKHVGEINLKIQIEQSLLSHHLKILRDSGLVTSQRDGKSVLYSLAQEVENTKSKKAVDLGCCLISFN